VVCVVLSPKWVLWSLKSRRVIHLGRYSVETLPYEREPPRCTTKLAPIRVHAKSNKVNVRDIQEAIISVCGGVCVSVPVGIGVDVHVPFPISQSGDW